MIGYLGMPNVPRAIYPCDGGVAEVSRGAFGIRLRVGTEAIELREHERAALIRMLGGDADASPVDRRGLSGATVIRGGSW